MKSLRRQFAMYLIFLLGLIVGMWLTKLELGWFLSVLLIPALIWFLKWDEIRYQRMTHKKEAEQMTSMKIPVPGKLPESTYGKMYYAMDKRGVLAIVGIKAPERIKRQYDFDFDFGQSCAYGLGDLYKEAVK